MLCQGLMIWCTLELCGVQLAPIFGLLTFLLNFVPNIGCVSEPFSPFQVHVNPMYSLIVGPLGSF